MRTIESLTKIRKAWISRISHRLARGEGVRESFQEQISHFYDLVLQAVETGDPAWLNPILNVWARAHSQTDIESDETNLPPILEQILLLTYEVAYENLSEGASLELLGAVLPVYTYALGYTNREVINHRVEHVTKELDEARISLESLDKSKSDFISIAAHELKTPLTLIEGYTNMLRDRLDQEDEQEMISILLKGIDNGTRRLREIVNDMIDVSVIDNNLLSLNFQPVWINRIFRVIEQEFKISIEERHLDLQIHPFQGSAEMIFADSERMHKALRNIISNAIKFTPNNGEIIVNGRKLPGFIEITVKDSGIGIDPDDHTRIFEKFGGLGNVSLHSSGKTKYKGGGPGLGLPITKGIVEAHGGAIWVESDGRDELNFPGTTFHIMIPLRKEPPDKDIAKKFFALLDSNDSSNIQPIQANIVDSKVASE